jgi:endonuclease III
MTGIEELIPLTIGILGFIDDIFGGGASRSRLDSIVKSASWRAMTKLARDIYNRLTDYQKVILAKVMPLYGETEGRLTKEELDQIYATLSAILANYNNLSNEEFIQRLNSSLSKKNRDKRQQEHDRLLTDLALTREAILNAGINNIENLIRYYRGLTVERPPYVIPKIKEVLDPRYYDVLGELERHQPQTIE